MTIINKKMISNFFLVMLVLAPFAAITQTSYQVKSHEITIEGTSNLHDWTADVEKATGAFNISVEEGKIVEVVNGNINIDVASIKGSEGRRMDKKIYDAIEVDTNPNITFFIREINSLTDNPGPARINANGVLTIAGVSKNVTLIAIGKVLPNGDLEFSGSQKVLMTDHKVSPPTALLGTMKTGDEVNILYKVVLKTS